MVVDSKGGTFEVTAKPGKSLDYQAVNSIIAKQHKTEWVELSVLGTLTRSDERLTFKASTTGQVFLLADDPTWKESEKSPFQRLRDALQAGATISTLTGRVAEPPKAREKTTPPPTLLVTGFTVLKAEPRVK